MTTKSLILTLAGAAFALGATPALAEKSAPKSPSSKSENQVYCVKSDASTGSHIRKTECKTKKAWLREGVDIEKEAEQAAS